MNERNADEILREFMTDVEAVGVVETALEWPDLVVTYNRARLYFKAKGEPK